MLADRYPAQFLVRASVLLVASLVLWWFVLQDPLLSLLKFSIKCCGAFVTETGSGAWNFRVPLEATIPKSAQQPVPMQIHSINFDVERSDVVVFTFTLPVYWAIVLAAPRIRRVARPLILGTFLIAILEIVLLLCFLEISAHNIALQWSASRSDFAKWSLRFGEYLVVNVIPYLAPVVVVLALHRELRVEVFRSVEARGRSKSEMRGSSRPRRHNVASSRG
jgi:hypothetical protein